jgi:hypothetical protein
VITRWQAARGYPRTGFLNGLQLKALQSEIVATRRVLRRHDGRIVPPVGFRFETEAKRRSVWVAFFARPEADRQAIHVSLCFANVQALPARSCI